MSNPLPKFHIKPSKILEIEGGIVRYPSDARFATRKGNAFTIYGIYRYGNHFIIQRDKKLFAIESEAILQAFR